MKFISWTRVMPLQIPFMTLLVTALAASTLLVLKHESSPARPGYAMAGGDAATMQATPYGSGAALRNLLF